MADEPETYELVAAVRAGFTCDIMQFTPTERRGFLTEYHRQEEAARRRLQAEVKT